MARFFVGFALALLCASEPALSQSAFVKDQFLVGYRESASAERIEEIERQHSLTRLHTFRTANIRQYRVSAQSGSFGSVNSLADLPDVLFVERNLVRETLGVPSDSRFDEQWSLDNTGQTVNGLTGSADSDIDLGLAMDIYSGDSEVVVAVIDSGVALDHPEFGDGSQWWVNADEIPGNGIDDDGNGYIDDRHGWDFVDADSDPMDENGHGTRMASLVAASQDDGEAMAGIAPHARIMALRVYDDSAGADVASISEALEYAGQNGARLVVLSIGRDGFSAAEEAQFEALDELGVLCIIAAGNGGEDGQSDDNDGLPVYPASYASENIVSVASTNESDGLSAFSNFGIVSVDLAAPGENILSADLTREIVSEETFDLGAGSWTVDCVGNCSTQNTWQYVFPGFSGADNWATDSFTAALFSDWNYEPNTVVDFISPFLTMPVSGAGLEFRIWRELAAGDFLRVEGSGDDGATWWPLPNLPPFVTGSSELPVPIESSTTGSVVSADLSRFDNLPGGAKIRFRLVSDGDFEATGVFIDDVAITEVTQFDTEDPRYTFFSGTSAAATIVTGVAALVMAERPDLSHMQVREILLSSVDPLVSLSGKTASGGRVNAWSALAAAKAFQVPEPSSTTAAIAAFLSLAALQKRRRFTG